MAPIEKVGERFERSWKHDTRSKGAWTDLLTQSQVVDQDDPEAAALAEQIVIDNHNLIQAMGAATPRKRSREEAMLDAIGQNKEELDNFNFTTANNGSEGAAIVELQEKVQILGKHLKAIPVLQTVTDIT